MTVWTFEISWLGRPQTMNAERNTHYYASNKIRQDWRGAAITSCRIAKVPKGLARVGLIFEPIYDKGPLPDPGALAPTIKGIIDGIVIGRDKTNPGYGVVADDDGNHVGYVAELAPVVDRRLRPGVRVFIVDLSGRRDEPISGIVKDIDNARNNAGTGRDDLGEAS